MERKRTWEQAVGMSTLDGGKTTQYVALQVDTAGGQFCLHCSAWYGCLGLEPTPELYVQHIVEVFREVWRVLHPTGTVWLNLGDTYATGTTAGRQEGTLNLGKGTNLARQINRVGTPVGLKTKDLCMIPARVALALQADGWWIRSAPPWVKCLSGGTRVYARTQKGEMPTTIKDLVRLDPSTVKLWNGEKWTQVLNWQETQLPKDRKKKNARHRRAKYRGQELPDVDTPIEIHLRTGERIGCTPEHKFPTQRGLIEASSLRIGDRITTCKLPEPKHPSSPEHLPDFLGWFIGIYIAEGSRGKEGQVIQIAGHVKETERFEKLKKIVDYYGGTCQMYHTNGNAATINLYGNVLSGILNQYITGKTAKTKHLSMKCWQRTDAFLRNLLMGYLEGDGHYDEKNNRWRLGFTKNDALAADLHTICARIGVSLRLKRGKSTYNEKPYSLWRGQIRFNQKCKSTGTQFRLLKDNEIVKIEKSRARKFWDIAVEDEPHLFALASGVLTHNSNPMPESVRDRPSTAHENWYLLTKKGRYFWDADGVRKPHSQAIKDGVTPEMMDMEWQARRDTKGKVQQDKSGFTNQGGTVNRNPRYYGNPSGRNLRTSDFFYDSLDVLISEQSAYLRHLKDIKENSGMLLNEDGDPLALCFNTKPYSGSHFATFNPDMIVPMIKASTSERGACPECGCQWERVKEQETVWRDRPNQYGRYREISGQPDQRKAGVKVTTLGFRPTCPHYDHLYRSEKPRARSARKRHQQNAQDNWFKRARATAGYNHWETEAAVCLDPFVGSGTVLEVVRKLGCSAVGIDLSHEYLQLARERLSMDKLAAWAQGGQKREATKDIDELPLFKDEV